MKALIRPVLAVAIASLLAVCLFGLRFACDPADLRKLLQEGRRSEQLQRSQRSSYRHDEAQERLVRELIAQQCSLSEALAQSQKLDLEWLQELEGEWPDSAIRVVQMYHWLWSDPDYYYRRIVQEAAALLRDRPEEKASFVRRLKKDYQQLRASRQTFSTAPVERTGQSH